MSTIKEVASAAGVSVATVSRVISQSGNVSNEKKEKVLQAIQTLNYRPNAVARYLRTARTKTVLVAVPDITNPFFSKVLTGIQTQALQYGYHVLLFDTVHDVKGEAKFLEMLEQKQVDGLILLTSRVEQETLRAVNEKHALVLACEYMGGENFPTVSIDNTSSARKMTHHFLECGYRKIAHITGPLETVLGIDRLTGYKQALQEQRIPILQSYIQEGDFTFESGYDQMLKLLALANPPDAIFAANDEMAIGAIKAIRSKDLHVPSDIGVAGFDDIKMAQLFEPALTTVAQPAAEIGMKSMEVLLDRMEDRNLSQLQYVLDDALIVRESTSSS